MLMRAVQCKIFSWWFVALSSHFHNNNNKTSSVYYDYLDPMQYVTKKVRFRQDDGPAAIQDISTLFLHKYCFQNSFLFGIADKYLTLQWTLESMNSLYFKPVFKSHPFQNVWIIGFWYLFNNYLLAPFCIILHTSTTCCCHFDTDSLWRKIPLLLLAYIVQMVNNQFSSCKIN